MINRLLKIALLNSFFVFSAAVFAINPNPVSSKILYEVPLDNLIPAVTENMGQWDDEILFAGNFGENHINFLNNKISFGALREIKEGETEMLIWNVNMLGSNKEPFITGRGKTVSNNHYIHGDDPSKWVQHAIQYKELSYNNIYNHIDLHFYMNESYQLKYDYVVQPQGRLRDIRMQYDGVRSLEINRKGQLEIETPWGVVLEDKPYSYQIIDGIKKEIDIRYELLGSNTFGFKLYGDYAPDKEIVVDPVVLYWSTFTGGTDSNTGGYIFSSTMDKDGNVYGTGYYVKTFPTKAGSYNVNFTGGTDMYVVKMSADGSQHIYSTYIGGSSNEDGYGIAVNNAGEAYVVGKSRSSNFPKKAAHDNTYNGGNVHGDIVLFKLNAAGSGLVFSTFLGGTAEDYGDAVALDANGNAFIIGVTRSADFDVSNAYQPTFAGGLKDPSDAGHTDYIFAKFSPAGKRLFSSFLGGSSKEGSAGGLRRSFSGIAVDKNGDFYLCGNSTSTDFPTTAGSYKPAVTTGTNAVVLKFDGATGKNLIYSTYIGPGRAQGIDVNNKGEAFVVGGASSDQFPTTAGAFQTTYVGAPDAGAFSFTREDAFALRLSSDGSKLIYSTYLTGRNDDQAIGIAVSSKDEAYIGLFSASVDFTTTTCALQQSHGGGGGDPDFVFAKLNSAGSKLLYSTYVGGRRNDYYAADISILERFGCVCEVATSITSHSDNFPTTAGSFQPTKINGGTDQPTMTKFSVDMDIDFDYTAASCNQPVKFTDLSKIGSCHWYDGTWSPSTWKWDFGDGTTSTEQNPTHTFKGSGTFQVKLHVTCPCDSIVKTINIPGPFQGMELGPDKKVCSNSINEVLDPGFFSGATYTWQDGSKGQKYTATAPGTYYVTVSNGSCSETDTVKITKTQMAGSVEEKDVTCFGGSDGSIKALPSGGTEPYSYQWDNGQKTQTATGLKAGDHKVTVTDVNGCQISATLNITEPPAISTSTTTTNADCGGQGGSATVTASGGTPGFTYSWSPSGGTAATASNLAPGSYTVTVTDANNCVKTETVTIGSKSGNITATVVEKTDTDCSGSNGSATIQGSGGSGNYTYSWSNGHTGATATNLSAGTYTVNINDGSGCTGSVQVTILSSGDLTATVSQPEINGCDRFGEVNAESTATPNGGTGPYTYQWDDSRSQTTATATGLATGTYTVKITDQNGCIATASVTVKEILEVTATPTIAPSCNSGCADGEATVSINGGTPPYTVRWNDESEQTTTTATGLKPGIYVVTVTDDADCRNTDTISVGDVAIGIADTDDLNSLITIYPNPNNGKFHISADIQDSEFLDVKVFNLTGQEVYRSLLQNGVTTIISDKIVRGIYLVEISSGKTRITKRIQVTR